MPHVLNRSPSAETTTSWIALGKALNRCNGFLEVVFQMTTSTVFKVANKSL